MTNDQHITIIIGITELDDDGRFLAARLADRHGRPSSDGETLRLTCGCGVFCRDLLTFAERARRFGLTCPVRDLEKYLAAVERCYGTAGQDREWRPYHLPGWQRMTDAERVNGLGKALRTYCGAGCFSPVAPSYDPLRERVLAALFGAAG